MKAALVAAAAALILAAPSTFAAEPSAYAGSWTLATSVDHEGKRDAAVDAIVADMNALIRGIARKRLRKTATYATFFEFAPSDGSTLTVTTDRSPGWTTDLAGTEVALISDRDEEFHLSRWMEGGKLHSKARSKRGSRSSVFDLSADGAHLVVTTTIVNEHLPRPLVYSASYVRKP